MTSISHVKDGFGKGGLLLTKETFAGVDELGFGRRGPLTAMPYKTKSRDAIIVRLAQTRDCSLLYIWNIIGLADLRYETRSVKRLGMLNQDFVFFERQALPVVSTLGLCQEAGRALICEIVHLNTRCFRRACV